MATHHHCPNSTFPRIWTAVRKQRTAVRAFPTAVAMVPTAVRLPIAVGSVPTASRKLGTAAAAGFSASLERET